MINIVNLSKTYNVNDLETKALKNLNLKLPNTGLIFIAGKSGCGKTTLLNLLGAIDTPTSGKIEVNGVDIATFNEQELDQYRANSVGFVFQDFNLIEEYSIEENIKLAMQITNQQFDDKTIEKLLYEVELYEAKNKKVKYLSGGQKQRVAIARALAKETEIILCDEPTGALDSSTSKTIFELLKRISDKKLVVVVSHDEKSAKEYADRIIYMKDGVVVQDTNEGISVDNLPKKSLIKTNMKLKSILKQSYDFFKKNPIRLMVSCLISIISLVLFGFSSSIANYNREERILESMYNANVNYFTLSKISSGFTTKESKKNWVQSRDFYMFNDFDVKYFEDKLNTDIEPIYYNFFDSKIISNLNETSFDIFTANIAGIIELKQEFIEKHNFELYGRVPNKDDEIVLSKAMFELYKKNGYTNDDNKTVTSINTMDDLIGKTTSMKLESTGKHMIFKIVGILDTKFDRDRYEYVSDNYLNEDNLSGKSLKKYQLLCDELSSLFKTSVHNVVFMNDGFYANNCSFEHQLYIRTSNYMDIVDVNFPNNNVNQYILENNKFRVLKDAMYNTNLEHIYLKNIDINIQDLENNQVILPFDFLKIVSMGDISYLASEMVNKFAKENWHLVEQYFPESELPDDEKYLDYTLYINSWKENEYQSGYTREYFENMARKQLFDECTKNLLSKITNEVVLKFRNNIYNGITNEKKVEIVGLYDCSFFNSSASEYDKKVMLVSKSLIEECYSMYESRMQPYERLIVSLNGNLKQDLKMFVFLSKTINQDLYDYVEGISIVETNNTINSEFIVAIDSVHQTALTISNVFFYISLVCLILSIIFAFYCYNIIMFNNEKNIGVIRSLGYSKKDVSKIYVIGTIIISFISSIVAFLITLFVVKLINNSFISDYALLTNLYNVSLVLFFLIILFGVVSSITGIALSLIKLRHKKIIDVIYDR